VAPSNWNFTVKYEYMVPDGSNSGFYAAVGTNSRFSATSSGKPHTKANAAIYNHTAPSESPANRGMNAVGRGTIIGKQDHRILNGNKIHDNVECDRATGASSMAM